MTAPQMFGALAATARRHLAERRGGCSRTQSSRQRSPQGSEDGASRIPLAHLHVGPAGPGCRVHCGVVFARQPERVVEPGPVCADCMLALALDEGQPCEACEARR